MLEPILVIPLRKVLPRMCTAAFRPADRRMQADTRLGEHIVKFESFSEIRVEDHRTIGDAEIIAHHPDDAGEFAPPLIEQRAVAEDRTVPLHRPLHGEPDGSGAGLTLRPPDPIEPGDGAVGCLVGETDMTFARPDRLHDPVRRRAAKYDDVQQ
jgi:hypothetical protein